MVGSATNAGLRRKAKFARDDHEARAMSVARALRMGLEKAADVDLGMALVVQTVQRSAADLPTVLGQIPGDVLLLLLEGPQGARGSMTLDAGIITSLIEAQTMGQVLTRPAMTRSMTRTDAAMAAPLVDGILTRLATHLVDHPDAYWASGYRYGAMMEDGRSLGLSLTSPDYHVFRLTLDIGPGARAGEMTLALPCLANPADRMSAPDLAEATQQFQGRVMDAPVRLDAVLCRIFLPLSQVSRFKAGDLLPLLTDASRDIAVETVGRRTVAMARLGKIDGLRAVRLALSGQALAGQAGTGQGGGEMDVTEWDNPMGKADRPASMADLGPRPAAAAGPLLGRDAGQDASLPALGSQADAGEIPDNMGFDAAPMGDFEDSDFQSAMDLDSFEGFEQGDINNGPAAA